MLNWCRVSQRPATAAKDVGPERENSEGRFMPFRVGLVCGKSLLG